VEQNCRTDQDPPRVVESVEEEEEEEIIKYTTNYFSIV
jgi:hypothetical protein